MIGGTNFSAGLPRRCRAPPHADLALRVEGDWRKETPVSGNMKISQVEMRCARAEGLLWFKSILGRRRVRVCVRRGRERDGQTEQQGSVDCKPR